MTAFTPGSAAARLTVSTAVSRSDGSTVSTKSRPIPLRTFSILIFSTTCPITVLPVPGWGWWPVMAVVELSSTTSVRLAWL